MLKKILWASQLFFIPGNKILVENCLSSIVNDWWHHAWDRPKFDSQKEKFFQMVFPQLTSLLLIICGQNSTIINSPFCKVLALPWQTNLFNFIQALKILISCISYKYAYLTHFSSSFVINCNKQNDVLFILYLVVYIYNKLE